MSGTWCERCRCHHTQEPFDEEALLAEMSKQIADDIDREILAELQAETNTMVPKLSSAIIPTTWAPDVDSFTLTVPFVIRPMFRATWAPTRLATSSWEINIEPIQPTSYFEDTK